MSQKVIDNGPLVDDLRQTFGANLLYLPWLLGFRTPKIT